jgi:hypothetical protein
MELYLNAPMHFHSMMFRYRNNFTLLLIVFLVATMCNITGGYQCFRGMSVSSGLSL